jgi:hypothetical protein
MVSNFEVGDGQILVRPLRGAFKPVPTPKGFTDEAFRNAVAACYTLFRRTGKLPSATELHAAWGAIPTKTYSALMVTPEWGDALRYRGVEWDQKAGLSLEQRSVLLKLADVGDRRSLGVKLRELGVPMPRYQAWLKHPHFRELVNASAEQVLEEAIAPSLTAIAAAAAGGDLRAAEKVLEITGRWNPSQQSLEDARLIVQTLVESIIRHVPDAAVRESIMSDVALAQRTYQAITS